MEQEQAQALRKPFPANMIGKLPKAGIKLDYVGHAAVTDRLIEIDPNWTWEPVAFDAEGAPLIQHKGNELTMWIRLTVCGVTRIGVGSVNPKAFDAAKQLISDAIRNAAMRFGVALDLWSKEELTPHDEASVQEPKPQSGAGGQAKRDSAEPKATSTAGESMQSFMLKELKGPQRPAFLSWLNENLPDVTITCVPFAMQKTVEDAINKFACGEVPASLSDPF